MPFIRYTLANLVRSIAIILLLLTTSSLHAQNFVDNGGFEDYDTCPDNMSQLERCRNWYIAYNSPDYFNCGFYGSIPECYPNSGTGLVSMLGGNYSIMTSVPYNELVKTKLLAPLKKGKRYLVKFQLGLGFYSDPINFIDFGLFFYNHHNPLTYSSYGNECFPEKPQININPMQLTKNTYTSFSFCYEPIEDMDSLLIGPFCNFLTATAPLVLVNFMFDDLSITEIGELDFTSDKTVLCDSGVVNFTSLTDTVYAIKAWGFESANPDTSTIVNPSGIFYNQQGAYDVYMVTKSVCGIDTVMYRDYIKVQADSNYLFDNDTLTRCSSDVVFLSIIPGVYKSIQWNNGFTARSQYVNEDGWYKCSAVGVCDSIVDSIYVDSRYCPCDVFVPSAFTPDEDGINDDFRAYGEVSNFHLRVYNRYAQMIFESDQVDLGWDGTHEGQKVPLGVYVYRVDFVNCKNEFVTKRGVVTALY